MRSSAWTWRNDSAGSWATASPSAPPSGSQGAAAPPGSSTSSASMTAKRCGRDAVLLQVHDYLDENRAGGQGAVGWYVVKIADASQSQAMGAKFDAMFENSDAETKTTEKGLRRRLCQSDGQHRRDHDLDFGRRPLHDSAHSGQHDGAVRPGAHQRDRRVEDPGVLEHEDSQPGAG